jgi:pyridinium-3,5-bisthiocarboxylic acid mononucleotide nickel chelatase
VKIAYFDCQFGAAGDMLLGALLGCGLPFSEWQEELDKIALPRGSFTVDIEDVIRCSISCKKVLVRELAHHDAELEKHDEHRYADRDKHEHDQHGHADRDKRGHDDHGHTQHGHDQHSGCSRNLQVILHLIADSQISAKAKALAVQIFTRLGQAEAKIHGVPLPEVHFHEVGAIDSIVDIVGFAIAYDMLKIEKSFVSPLPLGGGTVKTRHGLFPVPAPAAVLLLSDAHARISGKPFAHECLTPTGAAILATIASEWCMPNMETIEKIGYGAGTFNPPGFPNACRVFLAHSQKNAETPTKGSQKSAPVDSLSFNSEIIAVLEANLDDLSPQSISFAMDRLFEAGALDVSVLPAVMKKGRSGHLLTVICDPAIKAKLQRIVLTQTSSLGVRSYLAERLVAEREWQEVTIGDGAKIRIKIARDLNGTVINAQPEYDDCAAYATATGIPLKEVIVDALTNLKNKNRNNKEDKREDKNTDG